MRNPSVSDLIWRPEPDIHGLMETTACDGLTFEIDTRSANESRGKCLTIFRQPLVYFLGPEEGPIKIGIATNPLSRLADLQIAWPYDLFIYAVTKGGRQQELAYHRQFRGDRLRGEWFERSPDVLNEIARLHRATRRLIPDAGLSLRSLSYAQPSPHLHRTALTRSGEAR